MIGGAGNSRWERVRAAMGVYSLAIKKRRAATGARVMQKLHKRLQDQHRNVVAGIMQAVAADDANDVRRLVERARGKWRGSTIAGYMRGDQQTIKESFGFPTEEAFSGLVGMLSGTSLDAAKNRPTSPSGRSGWRTQRARQHTDPPTLRFKVAMCMYTLCHEGELKVKADVGSIGKSTLRGWLHAFSDAVVSRLKPKYMSGKPMSDRERAEVQGNFASRHGLPWCTLACDGSHVPFKPKNRAIGQDYRNYKGWTSILMVAFTDSFYRFYEVDVGYPGRAGDNTILARSEFMKNIAADPDKWLGKGGLILGDSGASDGDNVFLNPYNHPTEPDKCFFNFAHSSTRFFIEQTFGMWKSRFRFLLGNLKGANHKLHTKLIYTSTILHNFMMTHSGGYIEVNPIGPDWDHFFDTFKSMMCPECKRDRKAHCIHQAGYRNGASKAKYTREAPSVVRDNLKDAVWRRVRGAGYATLRHDMGQRAVHGIRPDEQ